ncbi:MAG: hypothetical protein QOF09_1473 [Alphaproteobacteria bacterium]|nr:hypothetical protein [Alphaproteobacteria bacterium]
MKAPAPNNRGGRALANPRPPATILATDSKGRNVTRNNMLYLAVGALVVVVAVLGYQLYQDKKKPEGVNINLGPGGISIEKK